MPVFIAAALVLIVAQPRLAALLRPPPRRAHQRIGRATLLAIYVTGVYGGYFGAAQGIMLLAILGSPSTTSCIASMPLKNVLAGLANLLSGVIFAAVAHVAWDAVGLIALARCPAARSAPATAAASHPSCCAH